MFKPGRPDSGSGATKAERATRRWLIVALAVSACVWFPAHAQFDPGQRGPWMQQGRERGDAGANRSDRGRSRESSQGRQNERERGGSMTPDERRELNRDLQRANREIYRKGRDGR